MSHTPGTWEVTHMTPTMDIPQVSQVYARGGIELATIRWTSNLYRSDLAEANAHLISAAPEPLEALQNMVSLAVPGLSWKDEIGLTALSIANKAIAKALGE